jgi:hypothetical protein
MVVSGFSGEVEKEKLLVEECRHGCLLLDSCNHGRLHKQTPFFDLRVHG